MIKIKWVVTDDISKFDFDEFDNEAMGIWGHFEITINKHTEGCYFLDGDTLENILYWSDNEADDILYWIDGLYCALKAIKNGEDYEMLLLTQNRLKFKFHLEQKLQISCIDQFVNNVHIIWTEAPHDISWMEEVEMQEFEEKILKNRNRLIEYIKKENPELLKSHRLANLLDV